MNPISFSNKDELIFKELQHQGPLGKRALFIFQFLFLRNDFRPLVDNIRNKLKIPSDGYDPYSDKDIKEFITDKKYIEGYLYTGELIIQKKIVFSRPEIDDLIQEYTEQCGVLSCIPNMYLADNFITAIIREYILFNKFLGLYKSNFALISVIRYGENTIGLEDQMEPIELRLEMPISAKKEEITDFINEIWGDLDLTKKDILKPNDFVRFRPRSNFIRDLQIYNSYIKIENLSKKEKKEKMIDYIELGVIRDLRERGVVDLPDSGTIRSIVSRLKNEIKDKNAKNIK